MITKIKVTGFKSLTNFELTLKQGLNILVGPNGAGKTNIILFFEFLSHLVENQVGNALSHVGGAGSIFQKISRNTYADIISSQIYGSCKVNQKQYIVYEYSFGIKISFEKDNVFYSYQELKISHVNTFMDSPENEAYPKKWDLDIEFKIKEENKQDIIIKSFDKKKIKQTFLRFEKITDHNVKELISNQSPNYYSFLKCLFPIAEYAHRIYVDLKGGETFNIIPSKVRELEDSATPPGVKKDGSGLATTLYAMKKSGIRKHYPNQHMFLFFEEPQKQYNPATLEKIVSFLKLANSTIFSLDVDNDPFNNKLIVKINIKSGEYNAILPLSSMSDGTIKWLTLITAILTSDTIFSIEEPENFLHPWMQAEIVNIMRNHMQEKKNEAFVLMTTHSESLLNHAKPEEIVIIDLSKGGTNARRISNVKAIKEEIANSGFGLGYFYFANSLNDE
jgi:AAA15 family ATPase/GTPase